MTRLKSNNLIKIHNSGLKPGLKILICSWRGWLRRILLFFLLLVGQKVITKRKKDNTLFILDVDASLASPEKLTVVMLEKSGKMVLYPETLFFIQGCHKTRHFHHLDHM